MQHAIRYTHAIDFHFGTNESPSHDIIQTGTKHYWTKGELLVPHQMNAFLSCFPPALTCFGAILLMKHNRHEETLEKRVLEGQRILER